MNLENNRIYTPKETLVYLVLSSNTVINKKLENLIEAFDRELKKNIDNRNILEKVNFKYLQQIENNWNLTEEEVRAYGKTVINNLCARNKNFELNMIVEEFIYVMKIFSPDEVLEFITTKQTRKNVRDGGIYYSPEQILNCIISSINKVSGKNLDKLIISFKEEIIQNIINQNVFKEYSRDKNINKWNLTLEQGIAYAYIVFEILMKQSGDISKSEIKPIFEYSMKLRSPEMAEKYFNKIKSNV